MKKIILLGIFLVLAVFIYQQQRVATNTSTSISPSPTPNSSLVSNARYVIYEPGILDSIKTTRRVLFFYASWCPTCVPAGAEFETRQAEIPEDTTLIRVNYNDPDTSEAEEALAKEYDITYQHTFVQIDAEGSVITRWNGGKLEELLANLK